MLKHLCNVQNVYPLLLPIRLGLEAEPTILCSIKVCFINNFSPTDWSVDLQMIMRNSADDDVDLTSIWENALNQVQNIYRNIHLTLKYLVKQIDSNTTRTMGKKVSGRSQQRIWAKVSE